MKYLHCLKDEKFIDGAITLFQEDKRVENTYVLFVKEAQNYRFRFISNPLAIKLEEDTFLNQVLNYDVVILHSLTSIPLDFIYRIPRHIKVVWLMWGFDFYNYEVCNIDLLYPLTYNSLRLRNKAGFIKTKLIYPFKKSKYDKVLERIDFFSGVFPYEYELFKKLKHYPKISAKPVDFYYGSTSFFVPEEPQREINNKHCNVIIGNSADVTNNTLDAFDALKNALDVSDIKSIIVPLSYGRNRDFKNKVKQEGNSIWGTKFNPLDKYMPLEDYLQLISNCKVAVFFHERQQASDNVLMQLLYGARVFMSETSKMYQYLKEQGYNVYSLQKDISLVNTALTDKEVLENRLLLSRNYSSSKLIDRVVKMNSVIADNIK